MLIIVGSHISVEDPGGGEWFVEPPLAGESLICTTKPPVDKHQNKLLYSLQPPVPIAILA